MPTERFFRLPKEKAETIRQAAIREFKRVSPDEASINKIIQSADISRGSFYTYFEDKYDLLEWLMDGGVKSYQEFYVTELQNNGGDIWEAYDKILEDTIRWASKEGFAEIIKNMMTSNFFENHFPEGPKKGCTPEEATNRYAKLLYPYIDKTKCPTTLEEFQDLMGMHVMSLLYSIKAFFLEEGSMEQIQASYRRRIKILRYGICPRP